MGKKRRTGFMEAFVREFWHRRRICPVYAKTIRREIYPTGRRTNRRPLLADNT